MCNLVTLVDTKDDLALTLTQTLSNGYNYHLNENVLHVSNYF